MILIVHNHKLSHQKMQMIRALLLNGSDVTLKHIDDLKFNGSEIESITLDQKEEISEWLVKS